MQFPADWTEDLVRKPICGVLAVAVIAGVTFKEATLAIKANMLPHQKRHGGKTYHEQRLGALKQLGVEFHDQLRLDRITLNHWLCSSNPISGTMYMINVTGHVIIYKDGFVIDQRGKVPYEEYPNKRQYVRNVTRII